MTSKIIKNQTGLTFNDLVEKDKLYTIKSIEENLNWLEIAIKLGKLDLCKQYKDQITALLNQYKKHHVL